VKTDYKLSMGRRRCIVPSAVMFRSDFVKHPNDSCHWYIVVSPDVLSCNV